MRSSNQKPRVRDTTSLAGWLFADLFLGLIIVFMASSRAEISPQLTSTPTPTTTPTQTATPSPTATSMLEVFFRTPTPHPTEVIGLDLNPLILAVHIDDIQLFLDQTPKSTDRFLTEFNQVFLPKYRNQRAGLVIVLGYDKMDNIQRARQMAKRGVELLRSQYPKVFPQNIIVKIYWWDPEVYKPVGTVEFEIYFYTK